MVLHHLQHVVMAHLHAVMADIQAGVILMVVDAPVAFRAVIPVDTPVASADMVVVMVAEDAKPTNI